MIKGLPQAAGRVILYSGGTYSVDFSLSNSIMATDLTQRGQGYAAPLEPFVFEELSIVVPARARNKELLAFRRTFKQYQAMSDALDLASIPLGPPRLRRSQTLRSLTVSSSLHMKPSFRRSVLKRQALPRMEL